MGRFGHIRTQTTALVQTSTPLRKGSEVTTGTGPWGRREKRSRSPITKAWTSRVCWGRRKESVERIIGTEALLPFYNGLYSCLIKMPSVWLVKPKS